MDLLNLQPNVVSESLDDKIFLFYGEQGTRKTTVAGNFEDSIIAGFEIGYKFISGAVAQPIQSWTEFRNFLRQLRRDEVKARYKTVVIDTVTLAYSQCSDYILAPHGADDPGDIGGYGKGWRMIRREFEKAILSIPQMGYGLVLIAHAEEMVEDKTNNIKAKVDIDKRPAAIIKGLADFIFYTRKEYRDGSEERPEDLTVYAYSGLMDIESKSRSRYFTNRFEFTHENLQLEMEKAIGKQKKIEGIVTVKEKETSPYIIPEENFEQLREDIVTLAGELLDSPASTMAEQAILKIMPEGVRLSEASPVLRQNLEILQEELLDIKDRLN